MKNRLFCFILFLMFIITFVSNINVVKAVNSNNILIIEDDANLLSSEEEEKLRKKMEPLTSFGHIAFKTISSNNYSTEMYASNYYHSMFGSSSGTLLLIDMYNRVIYIFSDGANYDAVTSDKAYIITDNVYKYASKAEYYKCASLAFSQINSVLKGEKISEPMRHISNALIAIIISAFICYIVVLSSEKIPIATRIEVLKKCKIKFKVSNVTSEFVKRIQVYSPRESSYSSGGFSSGSSSSSSSSGGSSSFGGGSSSGGGGGHRF